MTTEQVVDVARTTVWTILETSAPMLLISLIIGLIVSIFQTITSIQEQTLTFVPKFIAIMAMVLIAGNWILNTLVEYMTNLYNNFSTYIG
ncbi:MAG: flagellar biosynthesis protein FliQ [Lachnospiraceae bacterium]|nr:flagellar biosynthesis protein FliQ [Lachnospiraceae bacterium]